MAYRQKHKNVPIIRKSLQDGVLGEANNDGTIFLNKNIKPNSKQEKEVINHEMKHIDDMRSGKLGYGDDYVRYNGKTYPRANGKIKYNGTWYVEGSSSLPWEKAAEKQENKPLDGRAKSSAFQNR